MGRGGGSSFSVKRSLRPWASGKSLCRGGGAPAIMRLYCPFSASMEPSRATCWAAMSLFMSAFVRLRSFKSASCRTFMTVCWSWMICACSLFSVMTSPCAYRGPIRIRLSSYCCSIIALALRVDRRNSSSSSELSLRRRRRREDRDLDDDRDRSLLLFICFSSSCSFLISLSCLPSSAFCSFFCFFSCTLSCKAMEAVKVPITVDISVATMKLFCSSCVSYAVQCTVLRA